LKELPQEHRADAPAVNETNQIVAARIGDAKAARALTG
jgi:hypothetical protein